MWDNTDYFDNIKKGNPKEKKEGGGGLDGGMLLSGLTNMVTGIQMLGEQKKMKNEANQFSQLSGVVADAAELKPDRVERKYVRPEDNMFDPNELYPSYGTGTNFLAKYGKQVKKAPMGAALSVALGAQSELTNLGQGIGGRISGNKDFSPSAGSMIGSTFGPVGAIVGGLIDQGPNDIAKFQRQGEKNLERAGNASNFRNMQNQYSGFMQQGGQVQNGAELETYWGGEAEHLSINPHLPDGGETVLFKGNSHTESDGNGNTGIGVGYGDTTIEAEHGEPAMKMEEGGSQNLTIFGDMKIPDYGVSELEDPKAKGKKFKTYIKHLSELENKQLDILNKGNKLLEEGDANDEFERLSVSSGKMLVEGADMKLKGIAKKKEMASIIQNAILETADEMNLKPDALAKGKFRKAKKGLKVYAQEGKKVRRDEFNPDYDGGGWEEDPDVIDRYMRKNIIPGTPTESKKLDILPKTEKLEDPNVWYNNYVIPKMNEGVSPDELFRIKGLRKEDLEKAREYWKTKQSPNKEEVEYLDLYDEDAPQAQPQAEPQAQAAPEEEGEELEEIQGRGNDLGLLASMLPYFRPTNQRNLDPNQLMGEMYALSNNQLDPVQAQLYNPLLEQTSDISLQDQMNANQADFNSIQRMAGNNPAALSALAAQKYQANTGVLGEQFRINQSQKLGTHNRNRQTLNDATLKNMGIMDQQYTRQLGARSATKATSQAALNSIADKISRNKLENRTLGVYENLYNYRFGPQGRAWNANAPFVPHIEGDNLQNLDQQNNVTTVKTSGSNVRRNPFGFITGSSQTNRTSEINKPPSSTKKSKGGKNGALVKAIKNM